MAAFMWVLKEQAYGFLSALLHFLPGASSVVLCTCNCSLCKTYYTAVTESIFGVFKKISNLLLTKTLHSIIIALSVSLTDDYIIAENSRFDVFVKLIFFVSWLVKLSIFSSWFFYYYLYFLFWILLLYIFCFY